LVNGGFVTGRFVTGRYVTGVFLARLDPDTESGSNSEPEGKLW